MTHRIHRTALAVAFALTLSALAATASAQAQSTNRDAAQSAASAAQTAASDESTTQRSSSARAGQRAGHDASSPATQGDQRQAQAGRGGVNDRQIASLLIIDNAGEVALNQFAQQRTQSDRVRQFAEMLVRDHAHFIEQLQEITLGGQQGQRQSATGANQASGAAQAAGTSQAAGPSQAARTAAGPQAADSDAAQSAVTGQYRGLMAIHADAGRRKVQLSQEMLSKHQGAEFDMAFMGEQLVLHNHMLAMLQAVQQHASPQLQQLVNQGIQTTEQHLNHARQIVEQLQAQQTRTARAGSNVDTPAADGAHRSTRSSPTSPSGSTDATNDASRRPSQSGNQPDSASGSAVEGNRSSGTNNSGSTRSGSGSTSGSSNAGSSSGTSGSTGGRR